MPKHHALDPSRFLIKPGQRVDLTQIDTCDTAGLDKAEARDQLADVSKRLRDQQELLYANSKRAVLVVFQAMDAGGKDSTTRHVFGSLDPTGLRVTSFKVPTPLELAHDFLWRVHAACPPKGHIAVFNRSHYEDIVAVRIKRIFPEAVWKPRYDHIQAFERLLTDSGTVVIKFFLHISKEYQKTRMQRRLEREDKHWKFNPADLDDRAKWGEFQAAWSDVLSRCSTVNAPWYVIPAEFRPCRDLIVAKAVLHAMGALEMSYPDPDFDPATITLQ